MRSPLLLKSIIAVEVAGVDVAEEGVVLVTEETGVVGAVERFSNSRVARPSQAYMGERPLGHKRCLYTVGSIQRIRGIT